MLVLAILRLSDVFSFVLGVVYRLGLKQCVRRLNFGLFVMSYEKKRKAHARLPHICADILLVADLS